MDDTLEGASIVWRLKYSLEVGVYCLTGVDYE